MKLPLKSRLFNPRRKRPKYIIIHDTNCSFKEYSEFNIYNRKFRMNKLRDLDYVTNNQPDINFNYVIEKIKDDFECICGRPVTALCDYDDIPSNINDFAIHIGISCNLNFYTPDDRFYQIINYRIICPIIQMYRTNLSKIYTHSELQSNKELHCPGLFFNKDKLLSLVQNYYTKSWVTP